MEIADFAAGLRQMAAHADLLAIRHDMVEVAGLRRQVDEQTVKAQRNCDLIDELRLQVQIMGQASDAIGRMRKNLTTSERPAEAVQILVDALLVIDGPCRHYAVGSYACREDDSRTRGAEYAADAWCEPCVARDALERAGALPPAG